MTKSFHTPKIGFYEKPNVVNPDANKLYTLFTDTLKYALSAMVTQEYTTVIHCEAVSHQHPITYVSGLFQESQLNWAALKKEAYDIYMLVKKLLFFQADASITQKSDNLSQGRFHLKWQNK